MFANESNDFRTITNSAPRHQKKVLHLSLETRRAFAIYGLVLALTGTWSIVRLRNFESVWAWDLAHVNQSFWAVTHGVERITVRPFNHYAAEGPSPWQSVHFAVVRALLLPVYYLAPWPETLVLGHCAIFSLAVFSILRLAGPGPQGWLLLLVWLTSPAAWAFAINDCRPFQMGFPFYLWAIAGLRENNRRLIFTGSLLAMLCRQEYGVAISLLSVLDATRAKLRDQGRRRLTLAVVGLLWSSAYIGYLYLVFDPEAARNFVSNPGYYGKASGLQLLHKTSAAWFHVALLAPIPFFLALRFPLHVVLATPFVYLTARVFGADFLPGDFGWHHLRYVAVPVALLVAGAGSALRDPVIQRLIARRPCVALAIAVQLLLSAWFAYRLESRPAYVTLEDRAPLRYAIAKIPPTARVWTDYPYAALLSGRAELYSYNQGLEWRAPTQDRSRDEWAFFSIHDLDQEKHQMALLIFQRNGFTEWNRRKSFLILHRPAKS